MTLPSLSKQEWKTAKVETEKTNKLLTNIPTGNITELNVLIYAGVRLVSDKIVVSRRNSNRNTKPRWEMSLEGQVKELR